jgi:hypothetical protein
LSGAIAGAFCRYVVALRKRLALASFGLLALTKKQYDFTADRLPKEEE